MARIIMATAFLSVTICEASTIIRATVAERVVGYDCLMSAVITSAYTAEQYSSAIPTKR